uniref:Lipase n=1 Tax=Chlamydomonas euryale TaxID=1486919 RepID=A0A7R9V3W4_9CHLO|mmetsp:Transcript_14016/g.40644  ORF Transcript_14016/g.40644 Transcript_14016/m.40644 type:complete len:106 (+) Transcript_14016:130-447(+)
MVQSKDSGRFQLFDHGSAAANIAAYGSPSPPDVAENYARLRGTSVDLIAGVNDGVIGPENIRVHHERLLNAGVDVSYKEFEFGHLDFTFAVKEDLKLYMMRLLRK